MRPEEVSINRPIEERIAWAQGIYRMANEGLLADPGIQDLLKGLRRAVRGSREAMRDAGVLKACMACDREEGGSCCGAGLEDKYDGILLLINLLAGVPLPGERQKPGNCLFLGHEGCLLFARHVICVNYLCRKITDQTPHERLAALREKEGEELNLLFRLHERIRRVLSE